MILAYIGYRPRRPFGLWGVCIDAFLYKKNIEEHFITYFCI